MSRAISKGVRAGSLAKICSPQTSFGSGLRLNGLRVPEAGRSLRQSNPAIRLAFAGDPARGIAPCSAVGVMNGMAKASSAVAWSWAFDTPFKWTKQVASHFGGTRQGMVIAWPNRIKDAGGR